MTSIVSDATTLIVLAKLNRLDLLKTVFSSVLTPSLVYGELQKKDDHDSEVRHDTFFVKKSATETSVYLSLVSILDPGESEAIALALETGFPLLIDEKKGRTIAKSVGVSVIGMVGFLLILRQKNILDEGAILSLLDDAIQIGFRVSQSLYEDFCRRIK